MSDNPYEQAILYTCQVCKGTKTQVQDTSNQLFPPEQEQEQENTAPTGPVTQWDPDKQETAPGQNQQTEPTYPGNAQDSPLQDSEYQQTTPEQDQQEQHNQQEQQEQQEQDKHTGHDHTQDGTIPQDVLDDLLQQEQDEHAGHDHDHADTSSDRPATGIAVLAVLGVLIGGMVYFVEKKR